jgi:hypothetical protein
VFCVAAVTGLVGEDVSLIKLAGKFGDRILYGNRGGFMWVFRFFHRFLFKCGLML